MPKLEKFICLIKKDDLKLIIKGFINAAVTFEFKKGQYFINNHALNYLFSNTKML